MLILSRKAGESLVLDGGIEIKITEIYGDKVRIGIAAPPQVKVYRKELYATIQENQSAAAVTPVTAAAVRSLLRKIKPGEHPKTEAPEKAPEEAPATQAGEKEQPQGEAPRG